MRILKRISALSGEVSAGGGVTSGVYQGSGGLYFTIGEVGVINAAMVGMDNRAPALTSGNRVNSLRYVTNNQDSNVRPNQVRVEILTLTPIASGVSGVELGSGALLSGLSFLIDVEAEV